MDYIILSFSIYRFSSLFFYLSLPFQNADFVNNVWPNYWKSDQLLDRFLAIVNYQLPNPTSNLQQCKNVPLLTEAIQQ